MSDMLVKLYDLPDDIAARERLQRDGIEIRRALAPEKHIVTNWVREHFIEAWASECEVAFARQPVTCFIATQNENLLGFACFETTCRNFFGPLGIAENARGKGIGAALMLTCLRALAEMGYAYAIIAWAGPVEFFKKVVGAVMIENSEPGIYRGLLTTHVQNL